MLFLSFLLSMSFYKQIFLDSIIHFQVSKYMFLLI
nr:MAG TPA: hypothetical protein [Caudoviricetes sp.]